MVTKLLWKYIDKTKHAKLLQNKSKCTRDLSLLHRMSNIWGILVAKNGCKNELARPSMLNYYKIS